MFAGISYLGSEPLHHGQHPGSSSEPLLYKNTVEPLNKGHIGTSHFVHYREVVLFLMYSGTSE